MNRISIVALFFLAVLLLVAPGLSFAQGSDTLVVYASGETLTKVFSSDTTSSGFLKHHVYKLVSLDTTYLFDGTITIKDNITVLGVPDPTTGRPPCIQPDVLPDNSVPGVFFSMNGNGTHGTFKNLYLLGIAVNNTVNYGGGQAFQISGDSIRFVADNVVFEQWSQFAIGYSGRWDKFFITNCKFRNMNTQPNQWYVGEVIRNENYLGSFPTDSLIIKYNTIFSLGGYAACPVTGNLVNAFEFSHNSVLYNFKNPFFLHRITNAKFNNNIFYALYAGGQSLAEYNGMWDETSLQKGSVISLDTLGAVQDSLFDPGDIGNANLRWLAEAKRKVEVMNNVYFWPAALTNFWKSWDDTAHADSIVTPVWMNQRTTNMFSDKTHWPGFTESGNQNVDPQYGPSIDSVLYPGATANDVGLLNWFAEVRRGTGTTQVWGYKITQVSGAANWTPPWPLPESNDMKYGNTAMKTGATDGGPIGDPNWFGIKLAVNDPTFLPNEFALSQNYPNPFNPSTKINYTLGKMGPVSLKVYNITGQLVMTVVDNVIQTAGVHDVSVDMNRFATGVYLYVLQQNGQRLAKTMMLLK